MGSAIFHGDNKFAEFTYNTEHAFEDTLRSNTKLLFGESTIYIDIKTRISTGVLGGSVPDGLLFDLRDIDSPEFYLVEVELASHSFYEHIFPQITKFFAFFKSERSQNELIEKIFSITQSDRSLENAFKKFLGTKEVFKFIKDTVENSQNILLVIDELKPELPQIMSTYTDTWGKMVKVLILKEYHHGDDKILSLTPDFESVGLVELPGVRPKEEVEGKLIYSEEYHLDGVDSTVKDIYQSVKSSMLAFKPTLRFNPQKYYISIVDKKNFAYIKLRKTKVRITVLLGEDIVRSIVKHYKVVSEPEGVRRFYGGDCCTIIMEDNSNLNEVIEVLKVPVVKGAQR